MTTTVAGAAPAARRHLRGIDPSALNCGSREVHSWCVLFDEKRREPSMLTDLLSEEERARSRRFHYRIDARRFEVAHGFARAILSRYTGVPAQGLQYAISPHGKPSLVGGADGLSLEFNLAHTNGAVLIAVASGSRIGADIERIEPDRSDVATASRFCSSRELALYRSLREPQRTTAFFRWWTRKEAVVKGMGLGLSYPVRDLEVSAEPCTEVGAPPARGVSEGTSAWSLFPLAPAGGYLGTVAVEGKGWSLREFTVEIEHGVRHMHWMEE